MRQFLLIALFGVLLADIMLHLGLGLPVRGLSLKNALLYVLFVMLVLEFSVGRRDLLRETWPVQGAWILLAIYATFTWLVVVLLGVHRGYDTLDSFIALKSRLFDLILFFMVYIYGSKDLQSTRNLLRWLISIFVIVNVITLVDVFNIPNLNIIADRVDGRLTGPVNEVNQYGAILIFIIPITAGLALSTRGLLRLFLGGGALVAFVLLALTVSRGSYLGLLVGSLFALFLVRKHVNRVAVLKGAVTLFFLIVIAGAAIAYQNPEGFLDKFDIAGATLDRISSGRTYFWRQALTLMSYWPLSFITGYGWHAYASIFIEQGDPHNTYMLYWFNLGLVGLTLYVFIALWILRFTVRGLANIADEAKPAIIGFIMGFCSLHVALMFVGLFTPWLFIWAITGATLRMLVEYQHRGISAPAEQSDA